jgi:hypothetical protein
MEAGGLMLPLEKPIDPGAEFSKPKPHTLEWILDFIRRHPGASTRTGEADLLVAEIDRLRVELDRMTEAFNDASTYGH